MTPPIHLTCITNTNPAVSRPTTPMPKRTPRKKALLIGVGYQGSYQLQSTYIDVANIYDLLIGVFNYDPANINVMQDDEMHTRPTRANMFEAIDNLVKGAEAGDHVVFLFSGHGSQLPEVVKGTEKDGKDEVLWPEDTVEIDQEDASKVRVDETKFILDNDIRAHLVDKLPPGVKVVLIFDCCHSGTAADLEHCHSDHYLNFTKVVTKASAFRQNVGEPKPSTLLPSEEVEEDPMSPYSAISAAEEASEGTSEDKDAQVMAVSWAACRDHQRTQGQADKGGLFIEEFVRAINDLMASTESDSDSSQEYPTHEDLLHRVTRNVNRQITVLRRWVLRTRKASQNPVRYDQICKKLEAPRPQLGSSHDYNKTLKMSVLDMFGISV